MNQELKEAREHLSYLEEHSRQRGQQVQWLRGRSMPVSLKLTERVIEMKSEGEGNGKGGDHQGHMLCNEFGFYSE